MLHRFARDDLRARAAARQQHSDQSASRVSDNERLHSGGSGICTAGILGGLRVQGQVEAAVSRSGITEDVSQLRADHVTLQSS